MIVHLVAEFNSQKTLCDEPIITAGPCFNLAVAEELGQKIPPAVCRYCSLKLERMLSRAALRIK